MSNSAYQHFILLHPASSMLIDPFLDYRLKVSETINYRSVKSKPKGKKHRWSPRPGEEDYDY